MYKLIITEKPSVAREYVKILQIKPSGTNEGYVEGKSMRDGKDYRITWSVGHLVTLSYPDKYDEKLAKWNLDMLPFLPEKYLYETIPNTRKQFNIIKKLYNMSDYDVLYFGGDSGREGIYIQMLIRMLAGVRKGVDERVIWISSQTEDEILRGIREAKPLSAYRGKIDAAYMRGIEDYAVGINFSRALSCKFGYQFNAGIPGDKYKPIAVGRVMTCVLGMIVNREREIRNFITTVFYRPGALCGDFTAKWKAAEGTAYYDSPKVYNKEGFLEYAEADVFINNLKKRPELTVVKADVKIEKKQAPLLYNLAEIQNDCSRLYKLSPDETLAVIQELYEKKLVTYPRTDARVLSTAVADEIKINLEGLLKRGYKADIVNHILQDNLYRGLSKTRYCDDTKISDHYAIIPTGDGNPEELQGTQKDVYQLIIRRFLSIFYPPAEYKKVDITLKHQDNEYFYASEKLLKIRGYMEITEEGEIKEDSKLMSIKAGDVIHADYNVTEGKTTPPKRYNSGSMILAMENAGNLIEEEELREQIKSCGIGTSATRAEILKKLISNGYIMLEKKTQVLKPLVAGESLYDIVNDNLPVLLSPQMTASWEKGLSQIEEGVITKEVYLQKLNQYITKEVNTIKSKESISKPEFTPEVVYKCPYCGKDIVTTFNGFKCTGYGKEEGQCSFYVSEIAHKTITKDMLVELIKNGRTGLIKGFKSKSGKSFEAMLKLNRQEQKIEFEFPERTSEETAYECPKCGEHMTKDLYNLTCTCGCKIPHMIAKRSLQMRK